MWFCYFSVGKDNAQHFINTSVILYVDSNKKRIRNWLAVNRLQLPLPNFQYGFSNTIKPQKDNGVKNSISGLYKKDTKAPEKAKALLKIMKAESENYKGKQIDGRSIRNYTYKKSQNDKAEGVSNEYEPKHGEQANGIPREETVVYTRDDSGLRGRGKIPEKKNYRRARERVDSFLRRTEAKGLRRKEVGKRYYAYRPEMIQ